ncbi:hypothetical protein ACFFKH_11340 [Micromonospora marina]|uniref:Uncharacterized protein n=1 Tax=Micromonospora marina TaxID=307120 RepID=A0A1C4Y9W2_9ACTN|nr:hypothetical protein [Micromonospora marina]SCF17533.1 hypothetical protein GA0070215_11075 [Micromonospora marina]
MADFVAAGLPTPQVYGVEGPLWPLLNALGTGPHERLFADALTCAEMFERDAAIRGASAHLLAAAPLTVGPDRRLLDAGAKFVK